MKSIFMLLFVVLVNEIPVGDAELAVNGNINCRAEDTEKKSSQLDACEQVKTRRYDLNDLGYAERLHGWFDVQGQGAAGDYCRFVGNSPNIFLSCALAGTHGESEYNFNSQDSGFDPGYDGTGYMKDEDGDGRDDYCRCVGNGDTERVACAKAGPNGFYGSKEQPGTQYTFSPTGFIECSTRKVRPEFGRP